MIKRVTDVKWFKEAGTLTEDGMSGTMHFRSGLEDVMLRIEIKDMSTPQLQTLKSIMTKMVGDAVSDVITQKVQLGTKFQSMSDEDYYKYLDDRYGPEFWPIMNGGLSREEEDRLPQSKIKELLEKGAARVKESKNKVQFIPEDKLRPRVKK
jgi:hypothetical protein